MCSTESTILFRFHSVWMSFLVLCHVVITLFAFCACQCNFRAHNFHLHNFIVCFSDALFLGIKKRPTSKLFYSNTLFSLRQQFFACNPCIKNVNIKIDIFSCFYRFAILHNTQPVLLYIFTFRQRSSKAATAASLSRSLYSLLCKLLYLFLE